MRGIAIPFADINMMDLDYLDLHCKMAVIDGDKREVIVIEPDDELIKALKRLNIKYRNLSEEETYNYVRDSFF